MLLWQTFDTVVRQDNFRHVKVCTDLLYIFKFKLVGIVKEFRNVMSDFVWRVFKQNKEQKVNFYF